MKLNQKVIERNCEENGRKQKKNRKVCPCPVADLIRLQFKKIGSGRDWFFSVIKFNVNRKWQLQQSVRRIFLRLFGIRQKGVLVFWCDFYVGEGNKCSAFFTSSLAHNIIDDLIYKLEGCVFSKEGTSRCYSSSKEL